MASDLTKGRARIKWLFIFMLLMACVEPITFDVPPVQSLLVVEGMIMDSPGPYTVKLTTGLGLNEKVSSSNPIEKAKVKLFDDNGNEESFTEVRPGEYATAGVIRGEVGHRYHIRIETIDGKIFESEPDIMNPVGELKKVWFEFEARSAHKDFGYVQSDVFNIYLDALAGTGNNNFVRWRYKGTYKITTYPAFHYTWTPPYTPYKDPWFCSGYRVVPGPGGGLLEKFDECSCCECWPEIREEVPQMSDTQLVEGNEFKRIKVGEVPINGATFHEKFMVEVDQMSLSRNAYEFFKLVRDQKTGASSLFQPPSGEIRGNVKGINSDATVAGIFYATALRKKVVFIYPGDVPYGVVPIEYNTYPCDKTVWPNSTIVKPDLWN